jgi:hypothetical protein
MPLVAVLVNASEVRARIAQRRQQEFAGVDLWVALASPDRHQAASDVCEVATDPSCSGRGSWRIYPTTGGTYVWLDDVSDWERQVENLATGLERLGHAGSIVAPPVEVWPHVHSEHAYPSAVMAHRLDPPVSDGPFNVMGMPEYRWGVDDNVSAALLEHSANWVCRRSTRAQVGEVAFIPVTAEDAPEILDLLLRQGARRTQLAALGEPQLRLSRSVRFESFGQSAWSDLDDAADPVTLAEDLTRLLVGFAPDLDFAVIHPAFPGVDEISRTTTGVWNLNRHLWSSFVPDAFGIQLLTSEQLRRANDLTDWAVEEVSADRWIVRSRDLTAWFRVPNRPALQHERFPSPHARAKARHDFGGMILTKASAKANPRPTLQ